VFELIIIISSLLLSAFFSGMEIAYVSANKVHLELVKRQEGFFAKLLSKLTERPSKFIATMLVGNNIALVVYGFYMGDLIMLWLQDSPTSWDALNGVMTNFSLLFKTVISTLIILITAEFLPKVFFQVYSNTLLKVFAIPAYFFYYLFWFISSFVIWVSDIVLKKFFKTEGDQVQLVFSKNEIGNYISEQMEAVGASEQVDSEIQIFQNALEFSEVKAREVMVPRTEIKAVELRDTVAKVKKIFIQTGLSKLLVYKDTIDDVIGYVHSFELFKKPKTIKSIMLPVEFVPETILINDILNTLTKKRKSIAVVLDEYGGTSGLITVEDIVEELFGEIEDEHDTQSLLEEVLLEDAYLFSARHEVDYLNEAYKLALPEEDHYETLGGLIVSHTEEIPEKDQLVRIGDYEFLIVAVSNTKIDTVKLVFKPQD
jgi:CBS domain containing-hemolysin-like protein